MTVLPATQKVLRFLGKTSPGEGRSDTALGDWYANRIVIDRKPLLLLLSARSLLTIVAPARDLRTLPTRLTQLVDSRLFRLGVPRRLIDRELAAMQPVTVAATSDRVVLGYLVEFAKEVPYHLPIRGWDMSDLPGLEAWLADTPCHLGKQTIFPDRFAPELLAAKWDVN